MILVRCYRCCIQVPRNRNVLNMLVMRSAVLMSVLVFCAGTASPRHHRTVLYYAFEPVFTADKLILKVVLEFEGGPVDAAALEVPKAWGDVTDLKGVTNVRNTYSQRRVRVIWDLVK